MSEPDSVDAASLRSIVHTPGPWVTQKLEQTRHPNAQHRGMFSPYRILSESVLTEVAIIDGEHDAKLIAASPDLFAACIELLNADSAEGIVNAHEMARKAVSKVV